MSGGFDYKSTLFSIGNLAFREGFLESACLIYEYLSNKYPGFSLYKYNERVAKLAHYGEEEGGYHFDKSKDINKRLRIADSLSVMEDPSLVSTVFDKEMASDPQVFLAEANSLVRRNHEGWLRRLNRYVVSYGFDPLLLKPGGVNKGDSDLFMRLYSGSSRKVDGPLVTVSMSCFNAEKYVEHAVRSILDQTYKNIELIVFNDKSTDSTLEVLKRLRNEDDRIRLIDNSFNQGTYVSRNIALQQARGEYFTILDADDYALPQRIEFQVKHLQNNPLHVGVVTEWVRVNLNGLFHFRRYRGGVYQHEAVATMMIRTKDVREKVGYWDSVRFAADTEYQFRLKEVFGRANLPLLKVPTVISLCHSESLTNHPETGINTAVDGLSPVRVAYRKSWAEWHRGSGKDLYMPFPLKRRLFNAPPEMISNC